MDRLIALVWLRWTLEWRLVRRAKARLVGLLVMLPGMLLFGVLGAVVVFVGLRTLGGSDAGSLLPVVSVLATFVGFFWMVSPLLAGVSLAETHDLTRLMHLPIPLPTLVLSSLIANLSQPVVVSQAPMMAAVVLALSAELRWLPLVAVGVALSYGLMLSAAQLAGLLFLAASRRRRWQDLGIFLGLGIGILLSLAPILLLSAGPVSGAVIARVVLRYDVFAWSPFAWGARAAVHAGRGDLTPSVAFGGLAVVAIVLVQAAAVALVARVYRGELDLGRATPGAGATARMRLPGALGALVEKDLRTAWRDPAVRASLFAGLIGPLLMVLILGRASGYSGTMVLGLATFMGASSFGGNAFGMERRALALLFGLPAERWRLLLGKNIGAMILRLPSLGMLLLAAAWLAPLRFVPASLTILVVMLLITSAADNFTSILLPVPVPEPGREPLARTSGTRGLVSVIASMLSLLGVLAVSSPFVFLAWLPPLLEQPGLWAATLPLALVGAAAVYAMLLAGAARLLERREQELLERVLGDA